MANFTNLLPRIREWIASLHIACDGAAEIDGQGFSKFDADIGKDLGRRILGGKKDFSPKQYALMAKLSNKYRRQLALTADDISQLAQLRDAVTAGTFEFEDTADAAPAAPEFVEVVVVYRATATSGKAIGIEASDGNGLVWLPVSQIKRPDNFLPHHLPQVLLVKPWMVAEKRLTLKPANFQPFTPQRVTVNPAPEPMTRIEVVREVAAPPLPKRATRYHVVE